MLGPLYVLLKGFPVRALVMAGVTVLVAAGAAGLFMVFAVSLDDIEATIVTSVVIALLALMTQGAVAVELVRRAYLAAGYREGYY